MELKGIEKLREKLPNYPGRRIGLLPLRGVIAVLLAYLFLIELDILPRLFTGMEFLVVAEPFIPILGSFLIAGLALWLVGRLWNLREKMKAEYGDMAYQRIIPYGVAGVFLIPAIIFHGATSIRSLPPGPPINELTILWSQSLLPFIGISSEIDVILRLVLSGLFIILGVLTIRSAIITFGIDYMVVVYLYFPEESEVQENDIYSVIRHPTYLGGVLLGLAALFFRFSVYSIVMFVIVYLVFKLQARREEKELVKRFGESFTEYMCKVPAFYVSPSKIKSFLKFLAGK